MLLNINYSPRTEQTECSGSQSCENMFRSEWSSPGSSSVYQCTRSCQRCPGPWSECPPDHDTLLPGSAERTRLIQLCCWSLQSTELGSRDDSCLSYFPDQTFLPCSSLSTLNIQTVGSDWIIECNHCHCSAIIPSQWLMFVTLWSDKLPSSNKKLVNYKLWLSFPGNLWVIQPYHTAYLGVVQSCWSLPGAPRSGPVWSRVSWDWRAGECWPPPDLPQYPPTPATLSQLCCPCCCATPLLYYNFSYTIMFVIKQISLV